MTYGLYWLTNKIVPMRVSENDEKLGLDRSQHDEHYGRPRELAEYYDDEQLQEMYDKEHAGK